MKSALAILSQFLPSITSLHDFLLTNSDDETQALFIGAIAQAPSFETFLKSTLISSKQTDSGISSCRSRVSSMNEVIGRTIDRLLGRSKFSRQNCNLLCLGFRQALVGAQTLGNGVENFYPNTLLDHLKTVQWETVLSLIGDDAMMKILEGSFIFVKHVNGAALQVAGPPISELESTPTLQARQTQKRTAKLQRHRILYCSPIKTCSLILMTLPRKYALNCKESEVDELTKKMFYKDCEVDKSFTRFKGYAAEIRRRHQKCPYSRVFEYHCPVADAARKMDAGDGFCTQSEDEECPTVKRCKVSNKPVRMEISPDTFVLSYSLHYYNVYSFIKRLIQLLLPKEFLNESVARLIWKRLSIFIRLRRYESMSSAELCKNVPILDCQWAFRSKATRSKLEMEKAVKHLHSFLYWLFEDYVIPVIKAFFYVTDTASYRNRIFYFRHDVWSEATKAAKEKLKADMLTLLNLRDRAQVDSQKQLGYCSLRLVPKGQSFRPIMNLRRKVSLASWNAGVFKASMNGMLKNIHEILSCCRTSKPELMGASLLGYDGISERLAAYKKTFGSGNQFYFVKFDVIACYDSIPHEKLFSVLADKVITKEDFTIHKYDTIKQVHGRLQKNFKKYACPISDFVGLSNFVSQKTSLASTVLVDKVLGTSMDRRTVMKALYDHIFNNNVCLDGQMYCQKAGIPQGSILSALFCSFLYADLDHCHLAPFLNAPNSLLMRFIDDMIFITPSSEMAYSFVDTVGQGFPEYGFHINQHKTVSNFVHPMVDNVILDMEKGFPWCGLHLNQITLDVTADYSKFFGCYINDSLTIERAVQPVSSFSRQLKIFLKPKLAPLFISPAINSSWTIAHNVFQNFVHAALKMHVYLRELRKDDVAVIRDTVLVTAIDESIKFAFRMVSKHTPSANVPWLGYLAFYTVLQRKRTAYEGYVLEHLQAGIKRHAKENDSPCAFMEAANELMMNIIW